MGRINLAEPCLTGNTKKYVLDCIETGWISYAGEYVSRLEKSVAEYTGAKHAIAVNSGTAGLMMALKLAGVQQDDEVIVPTLTFVATINAIRHLNAHPVFMDCDDFLNMDEKKTISFIENRYNSSLVNIITGRKLKAIMPVHVFGTPAIMDELVLYAGERGIPIVEDAAESLGSTWEDKHTGTKGLLGVFSFSFNKMITGGTGGIIVTDDEDLAKRGKYLSLQAKDDPVRYLHGEVGYNLGLTNVNAAIALAQFEQIEEFILRKHLARKRYKELLSGIPGIEMTEVPDNCNPNYWLHGILVNKERYGLNREELMLALTKENIQTRPLWGLNHEQKPYTGYEAYKIRKAKYFYDSVLNIPSGNTLSLQQVETVAEMIKSKGR